MIRAILPFATLAAVLVLGNALAAHSWLAAALLGGVVVWGILGIAPGGRHA